VVFNAIKAGVGVLAVACAMIALCGCGSNDQAEPPTITSAVDLHEKTRVEVPAPGGSTMVTRDRVRISYEAKGADGGRAPELFVDVRDPEERAPPWGFRRFSHLKEVGQVTIPFTVRSTSPIVVQAQLVYEGPNFSELVTIPVER
jgi:hypothetical protein